jgi:SecD/SecF fusion protein
MTRTDRRAHITLVVLIALALAGVAALAVPGSPVHRGATLGLDLQGGLEVVLQAVPPQGRSLTASDLDRSVDIMRDRVDKLGVSEPEIRKQGSNQIAIELAGVHDPQQAAQIIGKTAQLELYDLETSVTGPSRGGLGVVEAKTKLYDLLAPVQAQARRGRPSSYYLFYGSRLEAGPIASKARMEGVAAAKESAPPPKPSAGPGGHPPKPAWRILALPGQTTVVTCGSDTSAVCPTSAGARPPAAGRRYFYLFVHDPTGRKPVPQMSGGMLDLDGTRADVDPQQGGPVVLMKFTQPGDAAFRDITRAEAIRGRSVGAEQHFAIVLDGELRSWPQIDYRRYPDGIDPAGGGAQITGLSSAAEAKSIALVLQTGALPVRFTTVERADVSATLGRDSLRQAYRAALAGLILVALFLLLAYRLLGLVAVIGLGIYAAFLYAAILLFDVTLTLPGFAGMILTIGVAADANVVVFERIKEEYRAGRSVRAAVGNGYAKGLRTIVDANVVTAITALVLFAVATAGVKGFALMLLIGTAISLVTAVAATRAMLGLLAALRWFDDPRLIGAAGRQQGRWLELDFAGRWRLWFAVSGAFLAVAAGSLGIRGLELGIDFEGGAQVTFATPQPTALADVRAQAAKIGRSDAQIQGRGQQFAGDRYRQFQVRTRHLEPGRQAALERDLTTAVRAERFGVKSVSSSFGSQLARLAAVAILVSLALIVLYIWLRFDLKFGIPVIVGMLHDLLITVGVYSLTGREVTASTVAAILTVLGYSIYDTVIIFDRIRENVPLLRQASFARIANVSLRETIRRSLATTLITLLPVGSLLVFGGDTLADFAFALLIGIASGAYSSIFVAAPLLALWKQREPRYSRRPLQDDRPPPAQPEAATTQPPGAAERALSPRRQQREQRRRTRRR